MVTVNELATVVSSNFALIPTIIPAETVRVGIVQFGIVPAVAPSTHTTECSITDISDFPKTLPTKDSAYVAEAAM
jgi:hypothetical protein